MIKSVTDVLNREGGQNLEEGKGLWELLQKAKQQLKQSRSRMSSFYDTWDFQDEVYRGYRSPDLEDLKQQALGKPEKMIVPNTFAQCQVFVSFLFLMFKQNRTFFEMNGTGDEDKGTKAKDIELILEQNLRENQFNTTLYQHLTDIAVRGPGILSCEWTRRTANLKVNRPGEIVNLMGVEVQSRPNSEWEEFVKYEGNLVKPISPYRFFPDTNLPLTESLLRGDFCAVEEEYTMGELRQMQYAGEIAGVDNITALPPNWDKERGGVTRTIADFNVRSGGGSDGSGCGHAGKEGPVIVTKSKMWICPHKFKLDGDKTLGPEEFNVLYHVWYANDSTLIRLEPAEEWHNSFGITASQFTPDMHHTVNTGLANLIYRLQDTISWAINSHILSVNKVIQNRLVVNVDAVDSRSLDSQGDIYLKKGFGRRNVNEAVNQLQVQDVTGGNMSDAQMLTNIMQLVTGVNDNLQGAISTGRRSAQENRVATAGAAGRMKLHGHLIWESGLGPLAQLMTSNSRQSLSPEIFNRTIGSAALADPSRYLAFQGTPEEIICPTDYVVWDSTLSSEKGFMAQSLQELLSTILTINPMAAQQIAMKMDPVKMVDEIQFLRTGSSATGRFAYPEGKGPIMPPPIAMPQPGVAA